MNTRKTRLPLFATGLLLAASLMSNTIMAAPPAEQGARERLAAQSSGNLVVEIARETGAANFIRTESGALTREFAGKGAAPEAIARAFLSNYGSLMGVQNEAAQLKLAKVNTDALGQQHVRFSQVQDGIDVYAADVIVHLDADGAVLATNGYVAPLAAASKSSVSEKDAAEAALKFVGALDGAVESSSKVYFNKGLITGQASETALTYRVKVVSAMQPELSKWVFVNAASGEVSFDTPAVYDARNRQTYNLATGTRYQRATLVRTEGSANVTSATSCTAADVNNAHNYAGDTYDFYFSRYGRDSYDNRGAALKSYVCYGRNYQNAFWDGSKMTYGAGFASADDVVAHELSHAVTEYASGLVYSYQSGALNESFSDIFGEAVDLTNAGGTDTSGVRWDMGEDIPGFGAIRDMADPTRFGDPDSTTSSYFYCGTGDNGGVHYNSGVPNKAFSLMVDGGNFGGYSVSAIGIDAAAAVEYRVNEVYLTSSSKFIDAYNALNSACGDLYGAGSATCTSVKNAALAVKMNGPICQ
jgi:bacillolysin